MILIDTSIWIEFLRQKDNEINTRVTEQLEKRNVTAFSPVFGELLQGVRTDREESIITELWDNLPQLSEPNYFMEAGRLSYQNKLFNKGVGLIDCSILAACKRNDLELWTLDEKLSGAAALLKLRLY